MRAPFTPRGIAFRAHRNNVNQAAAAANTATRFVPNALDPGSVGFDLASSRFIAPEKGMYHFGAKLQCDSAMAFSGNVLWYAYLGKNGVSAIEARTTQAAFNGPGSQAPETAFSVVAFANKGDYFDVSFLHNDSTGHGVDGSPNRSYFYGMKVA